MTNHFYIPREKEFYDNNTLIENVKNDGFVDKDTILVNCMPDYSSLLCQYANHKLSSANDYELLHQINLEIPYPTMSQVIDRETGEVEMFDRYLTRWISKHISKGFKYLFMTSDIVRGADFRKVSTCIRTKLDRDQFIFAATYVEENSIFKPDFHVEQYSAYKKGTILYQWENSFNPNW